MRTTISTFVGKTTLHRSADTSRNRFSHNVEISILNEGICSSMRYSYMSNLENEFVRLFSALNDATVKFGKRKTLLCPVSQCSSRFTEFSTVKCRWKTNVLAQRSLQWNAVKKDGCDFIVFVTMKCPKLGVISLYLWRWNVVKTWI